MYESSSTISSEKTHRNYTVGLIVLIIIPMMVSYALFLYKPSLFYFRPWEYFNEVAYKNHGKPTAWEGFEKGSESRKYFFRYQDERYTYVSTDMDGFRKVPFPSDNYEILTYGDSHCWGSLLSDHETFTWQLAKILNQPIFNGGRISFLDTLLSRPDLQKGKVIINVTDAFHVRVKDIFPQDFTIKEYQPLRNEVIPVELRRFYPPSMLIRSIKAMCYDLLPGSNLGYYMTNGRYIVPFSEGLIHQNYVAVKDSRFDDDLISQVARIVRFSQRLKSLGYTYVLVLVPRRDLIYGHPVDDFSEEYFPKMIRKLEQEGVYAVDLQSTFLAHKLEEPFFRTDTHWNARGTEIAAGYVADYLNKKGIMKKLELSADEGQVRASTAKSTH